MMNYVIPGPGPSLDPVPMLSDDAKRIVVKAIVALANEFQKAELKHRGHHGISGNIGQRDAVCLTQAGSLDFITDSYSCYRTDRTMPTRDGSTHAGT
jgi:hypothetical protein